MTKKVKMSDPVLQELAPLKQWVLWKKETFRDGRVTKLPVQANGNLASSTDPKTWMTFKEALEARKNLKDTTDGLGFVFTEDDDYVGIDLDKCLFSKEAVKPECQEVVQEFLNLKSYTEFSPSGTGLHIIVRDAEFNKLDHKNKLKGWIEVYSKRRYFTFTGDCFSRNHNKSDISQAPCQDLPQNEDGASDSFLKIESRKLQDLKVIQELIHSPVPLLKGEPKNETKNQKQDEALGSIPIKNNSNLDLSNPDTIMKLILKAKNADKFKALFDGNITTYPSPSEAVFAFVGMLAFYTQDITVIDSIFRSSQLYNLEKYSDEGKGKWKRTQNKFLADVLIGMTEFFTLKDDGTYEVKSDFEIIEGQTMPVRKDRVLEEKKGESHYDLHKDFMLSLFKKYGRDLLTDDMMIYEEETKTWVPIRRLEKYIRGKARPHKVKRGKRIVKKFDLDSFQEYWEVFRKESLAPKLLLDLPVWDEYSRLKELTSFIESDEFTQEEIYQVILEWGAKAWLRINNPTTNQQFLIFTGSQGCGKDVLCEALTGGFEHYTQPVILGNDQTKLERQLGEIVVGLLPEFDKSKFVDVSMLKDIITKPTLNYDQKYVAGQKKQPNRVSFIGSANTKKLLRDWTGNRRYRILNIKNINIQRDKTGHPLNISNYKGDCNDPDKFNNQKQILAEFIHHAEANTYHIQPEVRAKVDSYIKELTPEDPDLQRLKIFFMICDSYVKEKRKFGDWNEKAKWNWIAENKIISLIDAEVVFERVLKNSRLTKEWLLNILDDNNLKINNSPYYNNEQVLVALSFDQSLMQSKIAVGGTNPQDQEVQETQERDQKNEITDSRDQTASLLTDAQGNLLAVDGKAKSSMTLEEVLELQKKSEEIKLEDVIELGSLVNKPPF